MTHHAPQPGPAGEFGDVRVPGRSAGARARAIPAQLAVQRDALFVDADRHGPRSGALAGRVIPAFAALVVMLGASVALPWRELVIGATSPQVADLVLVVPVLVALVLLAAAMAPLARIRVEPLLGLGFALLGIGAWLARDGQLVMGVLPSSLGAVLVGVAAARMVRRAVWALPLLLAAGVSDAHSVAFGVTGSLLADGTVAESTVRLAATTSIPTELVQRIDLLVLHVPVATGTWLLGIVDVVAIGMLLGLAHLYWRSLPVTAAALAVVLAGVVAVAAVVPVLPVLGLAWIVANAPLVWRSTRFSLRRLTYLGG
jgi:hypothetical protein